MFSIFEQLLSNFGPRFHHSRSTISNSLSIRPSYWGEGEGRGLLLSSLYFRPSPLEKPDTQANLEKPRSHFLFIKISLHCYLLPFSLSQEESDLRKLARNKNGETNSSYEHSLIESSMDGESGRQAPRGRRRQLSPEDADDDFVNNFRDEGAINTVDKYARFCFPVSYLLFNICYWIVYLTSSW